jgi:hypothetical protein
MKKPVSLLALVMILNLLLPVEQSAADRSSGRGGFSGGSGGTGKAAQGRPQAAPRGFRDQGPAPWGSFHGIAPWGSFDQPRAFPREQLHFRRYPGYGVFLPGLIIGGVPGWSLIPRYATPPPYYAPPPDSGYPPPLEGDQPPPAGGQWSIYPREGQSPEQQDRDHLECHDWAVGQADFDPYVAPPSGLSEGERARKSVRYLQALESCLDVRGYTLR